MGDAQEAAATAAKAAAVRAGDTLDDVSWFLWKTQGDEWRHNPFLVMNAVAFVCETWDMVCSGLPRVVILLSVLTGWGCLLWRQGLSLQLQGCLSQIPCNRYIEFHHTCNCRQGRAVAVAAFADSFLHKQDCIQALVPLVTGLDR